MRRMICVLCFLVLCVLGGAAQQPSPNVAPAKAPPAQAPGTIRVGTQLVVEEVTVKDKTGKPMEGLTANDFTLTEDGVPQTISFVEYQQLPPLGTPPEP